MITVDKHVKIPKAKPKAYDVALAKACRKYVKAYETLYVRTPALVVKENGYVSIDGKPGVDLKRIKTMTKQLEFRMEHQ